MLEPAPVEYGLHRGQYDALVRDLDASGFRVRLDRRRSAYRNIGTTTFGTFYDLIVRLDADAAGTVDLDDLIERVQQLLSTVELPQSPRIGKILLGDGTERAFPLDEADIP